jgi:hypothetical protein
MLTAAHRSLSFLKTQNPPISESTLPHRSSGIRIAAVVTLMLLILTTRNARAQSTFGSIRGTVTDVSGAVITREIARRSLIPRSFLSPRQRTGPAT